MEQYRKLPRKERYTWYLFRILSSEKESFAYEEAKKESEQKRSPIGVGMLDNVRDYM